MEDLSKGEKAYLSYMDSIGLLCEVQQNDDFPCIFESWEELKEHIGRYFIDDDQYETEEEFARKVDSVTDEICFAPDFYGYNVFVRTHEYEGKEYIFLCYYN